MYNYGLFDVRDLLYYDTLVYVSTKEILMRKSEKLYIKRVKKQLTSARDVPIYICEFLFAACFCFSILSLLYYYYIVVM